MYSYSPSPSPAPASPPPNQHLYSPGASNPQAPGQQGQQQQQQQYPQARYSLLNKLQHGHYAQGPHHHHPQHSFSYPGPPASPAYSNGPAAHQQQGHHAASLPPHSHHASPHPSNGGPGVGPPQLGGHPSHQPPPPPPHHLSSASAPAGSPHPSSAVNGGGPLPPHWAQQLTLAQTSRSTNSPHHHARAAHLAARGQSTNAIPITDPNRPGSVLGGGGAGAKGVNGLHRKDASLEERSASVASTRTTVSKDAGSPSVSAAGLEGVPAKKEDREGKNTWTTIDMGGMNLKNLSGALFRYDFLTTLYIPHNALTELPPAICKLANLTLLDASSNKLSTLPPELGLLTRLRDLFLFDNHLTSLPPQLGTLHLLDTLGVEGNPLPDTLRSLIEKDGTAALIAYLRDSCPVPPPPPERAWLAIEPDVLPLPDKRPEETFSLLCYNILCDKYATGQMYGYTPSWALNWDYRKELVLQEVLNYGSDIVCLQEVDAEQYETYFLEHLSAQEYDGVHYSKSRARTMSGDEKRSVDGCATFFKNTVFALVEQHLVEFNQIALRRPDFKKTEDMFNRVMTKDNIAVVTLLEHRASGARLIVANAHIHWDPEFCDVKLVQVAMLMEEIGKVANDFARLPARRNLAEGYDEAPHYANGSKIPTIICGDFNSTPESGVYQYLQSGRIEHDHDDFGDHVYGIYTQEGLNHRLGLKSAYSHVGSGAGSELPFTNYTPGFKGTIDYVWYTAQSLGVQGLLGEVDPQYLASTVGFPNAHFPSDHISLLTEFKLK
ncbi:Glucose-repressible alcohol dehydrogenase transcriptional effector [Rhodotorula kratochvilovae]